FCIVTLMFVGILYRRRRVQHVWIMSIAMVWDILLILQIELSRAAVLKASKAITNTLMLNIHVSIALATVIFYGFMVYTGRAMLSGRTQFRAKHKFLGYSTFILRILTFITSFWAVAPKE